MVELTDKKRKSPYYLWGFALFLVIFGTIWMTKFHQSDIADQDTLTLNFTEGHIPSLHPHEIIMSTRGIAVGKWLFESLTRLNPKGEIELAGAEKLEISPCQKKYSFTLRPHCYSDDTPVLASDYEKSWKAALAPDSKCSRAHFFYCIKGAKQAKQGLIPIDSVGVKALDAHTLLVELAHPTPYFLSLLTSPLFAPFKEKGQEIITNGPYRVDEWKSEDVLTLTPNPSFWDYDQIKLKKIKILNIKDATTGYYLYQKGQIDWIGPPFFSPTPEDFLFERANHRFSKIERSCPFWAYVNTECFPLSSPLIRRALSLAINRTLIADHIFTDSTPLYTPFLGANPRSAIEENVVRAKELFAQGLKELGLTQETFPPITFSSCHLAEHRKLGEYIKESWEQAFGIVVELEVQEWNVFYHNLQVGNYQVGGSFVPRDYDDSLAPLERFAYESNFPRWKCDRYRDAVTRAKKEGNAELRAKWIEKAETILAEEMPMIWLTNEAMFYRHRSDLKNVAFNYAGIPDLRWAYLSKSDLNRNRYNQGQPND